MQQSKARHVSSRLCRAVNGVCDSKSLCLIFFRTRAMCCVPCAECHVTSMEGPTYGAVAHRGRGVPLLPFFLSGPTFCWVGTMTARLEGQGWQCPTKLAGA
ncbi:hypothetical protein PoB_000842700 [Plakobranchus ocellatus]|uniref:Uncharacterized protein n=1 Tax=Plakobranchus ocellatus TaxID=259542 RepID=A0AAV3YIB2_9GAST|nr:hypothetical protein PoB_000842700 [Plakobranchus ocellatus]